MIKIKYDPNCEMMLIYKDDDCIFHGNYWDFDKSPRGLQSFLSELNIEVELEQYEYED